MLYHNFFGQDLSFLPDVKAIGLFYPDKDSNERVRKLPRNIKLRRSSIDLVGLLWKWEHCCAIHMPTFHHVHCESRCDTE